MISFDSGSNNVHAKRAEKVLNAIATYMFEEDCFLRNNEKLALKNANEILNKVIDRYKK